VIFLDDILLRAIGISVPPFDMIWLMETIDEYARGVFGEETKKQITRILKENRLLYELKEITQEEYENKNNELNRKLKEVEKVDSMNAKHKISLLR